MIQTLPNGTTVRQAEGGLRIVNMGALGNAGTTTLVRGLPGANQAALGDVMTGTRADHLSTHTIVMPQMPVGSEIEFQIAFAGVTAPPTVTFQELDAGGVARTIQHQTDAGAAAALTGAATLFPVTDAVTLTAGLLSGAGFTTATAVIRLRKNLPSSSLVLSDGWTVLWLGVLVFT